MMTVNLLPWREQVLAKERRRYWLEALIGIAVSWALLWIALSVSNHHIKNSQERIILLRARLEKINKVLEKTKSLYQGADYQKIPDIDIQVLLNQQKRFLDVLRTIAQSMPSLVLLNQVQFENNLWRVHGIAPHIKEIVSYYKRLGNLFKKSNSLEIHQKDGLFYFQFRISLD